MIKAAWLCGSFEACASPQYKGDALYSEPASFPADVGARERRLDCWLGISPCAGEEREEAALTCWDFKDIYVISFFLSGLKTPFWLVCGYTLRAMTVLNYPPALCNCSSEASPTTTNTTTTTTRP